MVYEVYLQHGKVVLPGVVKAEIPGILLNGSGSASIIEEGDRLQFFNGTNRTVDKEVGQTLYGSTTEAKAIKGYVVSCCNLHTAHAIVNILERLFGNITSFPSSPTTTRPPTTPRPQSSDSRPRTEPGSPTARPRSLASPSRRRSATLRRSSTSRRRA